MKNLTDFFELLSGILLTIIALAFWIGIPLGIIYIVIHFVMKYW